jgi:hypothetical protein
MSLETQLQKIADLENVSYDINAKVNGETAQNLFCANWESAKKGLEAVQASLKNPALKLLVGIVITLGEGYKQKHCPQ